MVVLVYKPSLASHTLHIDRKGLVQYTHCTRSSGMQLLSLLYVTGSRYIIVTSLPRVNIFVFDAEEIPVMDQIIGFYNHW